MAVVEAFLLVGFAALLGVGLWIYMGAPDAAKDLEPPAAPIEVTVDRAPAELRVPVDVEIGISGGVDIVAPGWSGTVTEVSVTSGNTITSGTIIAKIDGIGRMAFHSSSPFFRPISRGDSGQDVDELGAMLVALGLMDSYDGLADRAMIAAVRELGDSLGVPDSARIESFDPAWCVFLPVPEVTVDEVSMSAGGLAPTQGQEILTSRPTIASVVLSPDQALGSGTSPMRVEVAGLKLPVDESLAVEDPLDHESAQILIDAVSTEGALSSGVVKGQLVLSHVDDAVEVPTASLVPVSGTPDLCLVVSHGIELEARSVELIASDSASSSSYVTGVVAGENIVVGPLDAAIRRYCESAA